MKNFLLPLLLLTLSVIAPDSWAQDAEVLPDRERGPDSPQGAEQPAAEGATPPPAYPEDSGEPGTTIIGDVDSPIGLYIMPWRNSAAGDEMGRPARHLQEAMLPIDRDSFRRQIDYYETLEAHRAQQAAAQP